MIQVLDSEDEPDRLLGVYTSSLVITCGGNSSKEEENEMALNKKKSLHELFTKRAKGLASKDTQGLNPFLLSSPPSPTVNMFAVANLKKKRKENEVPEEGNVVPQKEPKQQKMAKGQGRVSSIESNEAEHSADMHHLTWNPRLELDGAGIPRSSSIREFQKCHALHMAEALERPLLLSKDIDALKNMRQPDLFMPLKRDLALVSFST